jgi:hypothetical protein
MIEFSNPRIRLEVPFDDLISAATCQYSSASATGRSDIFLLNGPTADISDA